MELKRTENTKGSYFFCLKKVARCSDNRAPRQYLDFKIFCKQLYLFVVVLSLKDVGPLRSTCLRRMEEMLLKDCESEEVINTNKRNTNADMCVESVLQAIIQKYISFHSL